VGAPVDLFTSPADAIVARLVGSDDVLRELRYLTASSAEDVAYSRGPADGERLPSCSPDTSLLDAMLKLFSTHAPALVLEAVDGLPVRHVTLGSIISTLQKGHLWDGEP
jgi:osmoprotectant transport system ATP-binding protein